MGIWPNPQFYSIKIYSKIINNNYFLNYYIICFISEYEELKLGIFKSKL